MKRNVKNDKVLRAMAIGLATMIAATSSPIMVLAADDSNTEEGSAGVEQSNDVGAEMQATEQATEAAEAAAEQVCSEVAGDVSAISESDDKTQEAAGNLNDFVTTQAPDIEINTIIPEQASGSTQPATQTAESTPDTTGTNPTVTKEVDGTITYTYDLPDEEKYDLDSIKTDAEALKDLVDDVEKDTAVKTSAAGQSVENIGNDLDSMKVAEDKAQVAEAAADDVAFDMTLEVNRQSNEDLVKKVEDAGDALSQALEDVKSADTIEEVNSIVEDVSEKAEKAKADYEKKQKAAKNIQMKYFAVSGVLKAAEEKYNKALEDARNNKAGALKALDEAEKELADARSKAEDLGKKAEAAGNAAKDAKNIADKTADEAKQVAVEAKNASESLVNRAESDAKEKSDAYDDATKATIKEYDDALKLLENKNAQDIADAQALIDAAALTKGKSQTDYDNAQALVDAAALTEGKVQADYDNAQALVDAAALTEGKVQADYDNAQALLDAAGLMDGKNDQDVGNAQALVDAAALTKGKVQADYDNAQALLDAARLMDRKNDQDVGNAQALVDAAALTAGKGQTDFDNAQALLDAKALMNGRDQNSQDVINARNTVRQYETYEKLNELKSFDYQNNQPEYAIRFNVIMNTGLDHTKGEMYANNTIISVGAIRSNNNSVSGTNYYAEVKYKDKDGITHTEDITVIINGTDIYYNGRYQSLYILTTTVDGAAMSMETIENNGYEGKKKLAEAAAMISGTRQTDFDNAQALVDAAALMNGKDASAVAAAQALVDAAALVNSKGADAVAAAQALVDAAILMNGKDAAAVATAQALVDAAALMSGNDAAAVAAAQALVDAAALMSGNDAAAVAAAQALVDAAALMSGNDAAAVAAAQTLLNAAGLMNAKTGQDVENAQNLVNANNIKVNKASDYSAAMKKKSDAETANKVLREALQARQKASDQLDDVDGLIENYKKDYADHTTLYEKLKSAADTEKDKISGLEKKISDLKKLISNINLDLIKDSDAVKAAKDRLGSLEKQLSAANKALADAKDDYETIDGLLGQLESTSVQRKEQITAELRNNNNNEVSDDSSDNDDSSSSSSDYSSAGSVSISGTTAGVPVITFTPVANPGNVKDRGVLGARVETSATQTAVAQQAAIQTVLRSLDSMTAGELSGIVKNGIDLDMTNVDVFDADTTSLIVKNSKYGFNIKIMVDGVLTNIKIPANFDFRPFIKADGTLNIREVIKSIRSKKQ